MLTAVSNDDHVVSIDIILIKKMKNVNNYLSFESNSYWTYIHFSFENTSSVSNFPHNINILLDLLENVLIINQINVMVAKEHLCYTKKSVNGLQCEVIVINQLIISFNMLDFVI